MCMDHTPRLLLIETATEVCSVAVSHGDEVVCVREHTDGMEHARLITRLIAQVLEEIGGTLPMIDAVALSKGPGSYTALRIGASAAKGICYALDKPLIAVGTLQALAYASWQASGRIDAFFVPMIDARRMDVYLAVYGPQAIPIEPPRPVTLQAHTFDELLEKGKPLVFAGNGAAKYRPLFTHPLGRFLELHSSAAHLAPLAVERYRAQQFESLAHFTPEYVKAPHITTPRKKLL